ncbi:helix-turn-helix domain-containing protein [Actinomyces oricola]
MDNRKDVHDFLASRRARLTPAEAGLPAYGSNRRVPGLRREEVAMLAGVSIDYYAKLERGDLRGVSSSVLSALARALQLDEPERDYLFALARNATSTDPQPRGGQRVRPSILALVDGMGAVPAYLRNSTMDVLGANRLCIAVYNQILAPGGKPLNLARFVFLDPRAQDFLADWETFATDIVAVMRAEVGRDPLNQRLGGLVDHLRRESDAFAARWKSHAVGEYPTARVRFRNDRVGELDLTADALHLTRDNLTIIAYTPAPGSSAEAKLRALAEQINTLS